MSIWKMELNKSLEMTFAIYDYSILLQIQA
jgi:hypothetical protein